MNLERIDSKQFQIEGEKNRKKEQALLLKSF